MSGHTISIFYRQSFTEACCLYQIHILRHAVSQSSQKRPQHYRISQQVNLMPRLSHSGRQSSTGTTLCRIRYPQCPQITLHPGRYLKLNLDLFLTFEQAMELYMRYFNGARLNYTHTEDELPKQILQLMFQ